VVTLFHETHTHGLLIRPDGVTFAHYAGVIRRARAELPEPSRSLFLGNGDDIALSLCGVDTGGRHVLEAFAAGGLDADTFGLNEIYEAGPKRLPELVRASRFSWVSANVLDPGGADVFAKDSGARRWVVRDLQGVRVGITGLVTTERTTDIPGFRIIDPVAAMREVVPLMKSDGAQTIVVLSHLSDEEMERLALEVEGIDAIVGFHTGRPSSSRVVRSTIIAAGLDNMHEVGQLDLAIRDGRVIAHRFSVLGVSTSSPRHEAVDAVLQRYVKH
jgi:5'-nucleotidase/UDP-sugar diphosphatase